MPCQEARLDADATAAAPLALERAQHERFAKLYSTLRKKHMETMPDEQLDALGMARGSPLDVDNLGAPGPGDESRHFFSPCDWTQSSLAWESYSGYTDSNWMDFTKRQPSLWPDLYSSNFRFDWFKTRLLSLESILENVWEPAARPDGYLRFACLRPVIKERIGLELPRYESYVDVMKELRHEWRGTWAYFALPEADKPHAVCVMLDSASPADGVASGSEVEAAVKMTEFQLQRARFTHHFVKPILVCTYFRNQTARITQVHFDGTLDRLVLRQSRVLNLSGATAPPDAWLMLRWMASGPVGLTLYQPSSSVSPVVPGGDGASRPLQIATAGCSVLEGNPPSPMDSRAVLASPRSNGGFHITSDLAVGKDA